MSKNHLSLAGRMAVVVGATSGLGRAVAIGLAEHGADVVPTGRRVDLVNEVCGEIEALGRRTVQHACDVQDRSSIQQLRTRLLKEFDRIDILVNAAGRSFRRSTISITDEEWSSLFDINLTGVLRACQEFYLPLKASGSGRVINLVSLSSYRAFHEVAAYSASKAAVLSLTQSLACEWAADNICVNAIAPGVFPTELNSALLTGTERGREILMRTPMHRFGDPQEVVGAAVLLASDCASYITGECLVVDGGFLASGVNT